MVPREHGKAYAITLDDMLRQHLGQIPTPPDEAELLVSATRFAGYIAEQPLRFGDLMVFVGFAGSMIATKLAASSMDCKLAHQQARGGRIRC
jgi:hypothetical protein